MIIGIIEDDKLLHQALQITLQNAGYQTVSAYTKQEAFTAITGSESLLLIDIGLPDGNGITCYKELQKKGKKIPAIFLTARDEEKDMLQAFGTGADDYVVKPFDSKELIARIRAVMRRSGQPEEIEKHIKIGSLDIDTNNRVVYVDGNRIELAPKEFDLLCYFIHNNGKVLTRGQLLDDVWGFEFYGDSRTVDVHVKRLRDKLGQSDFWSIRTVWRVGYKFERFDLPMDDADK